MQRERTRRGTGAAVGVQEQPMQPRDPKEGPPCLRIVYVPTACINPKPGQHKREEEIRRGQHG